MNGFGIVEEPAPRLDETDGVDEVRRFVHKYEQRVNEALERKRVGLCAYFFSLCITHDNFYYAGSPCKEALGICRKTLERKKFATSSEKENKIYCAVPLLLSDM